MNTKKSGLKFSINEQCASADNIQRAEADTTASPVSLDLLQSWHNPGIPSPSKNNSIIKVSPPVSSRFIENDKGYNQEGAWTRVIKVSIKL